MSRRGSNNSDWRLILFVFIVGVPLFLIMNAPILFFLVVLPLAIIGIVKFIKWLKK